MKILITILLVLVSSGHCGETTKPKKWSGIKPKVPLRMDAVLETTYFDLNTRSQNIATKRKISHDKLSAARRWYIRFQTKIATSAVSDTDTAETLKRTCMEVLHHNPVRVYIEYVIKEESLFQESIVGWGLAGAQSAVENLCIETVLDLKANKLSVEMLNYNVKFLHEMISGYQEFLKPKKKPCN